MKKLLLGVLFLALVLLAGALFGRVQNALASDRGINATFGRVTCTTTAVQLTSISGAAQVGIKTPAAGSTVYIGDASVTADANYLHFAANEGGTFNVSNSNKLYCRVAAGTQVLPFVVEQNPIGFIVAFFCSWLPSKLKRFRRRALRPAIAAAACLALLLPSLAHADPDDLSSRLTALESEIAALKAQVASASATPAPRGRVYAAARMAFLTTRFPAIGAFGMPFLGASFSGGGSSSVPDPIVPADGTQNVTGDVAVSGSYSTTGQYSTLLSTGASGVARAIATTSFYTANASGQVLFVVPSNADSPYFYSNAADGTAVARLSGTLDVQTSAVGNVGVGEDTLLTYSIPLNTMRAGTANRAIRVTMRGRVANVANTKTVKLHLGTAVVLTNVIGTTSGANYFEITADIVRTGASTQDVAAKLIGNVGASAAFLYDQEYSAQIQTDTAAIVLKVTGEATTNDDIVAESWHVEVLN